MRTKKLKFRPSKIKNPEIRMCRDHEKVVAFFGGEFLNHGWASGSDFITSKTTVGRLHSEVDKKGRVHHWWLAGGGRGFSAELTEMEPIDFQAKVPLDPATRMCFSDLLRGL